MDGTLPRKVVVGNAGCRLLALLCAMQVILLAAAAAVVLKIQVAPPACRSRERGVML